ncbi:unnamed protein product [Caenorhabditis angaria]|uniref:Uncharacterized protein n=1 Tax=Caenorhabditis angaria TaxID=860376 RepID=A0A9P1N1Y2_9PELO|nr:unnamed protein product [Caenorhabditis angaria]
MNSCADQNSTITAVETSQIQPVQTENSTVTDSSTRTAREPSFRKPVNLKNEQKATSPRESVVTESAPSTRTAVENIQKIEEKPENEEGFLKSLQNFIIAVANFFFWLIVWIAGMILSLFIGLVNSIVRMYRAYRVYRYVKSYTQ